MGQGLMVPRRRPRHQARRVLEERRQGREFRLRKATFKGEGLQQGVQGGSWQAIRDLAYQGRGG